MVVRPAGAQLKVVFGPGADEQFVSKVEQIWATLDPVLYESVEAAVEATRSVAHMLVAHDGSRNLFDEVPQLMNGFETMQMVNVTREAEALQSMTSMLTVAMIQQLVGGSKVLLHAAAIGDPATKRAITLVGASGSGKTTASHYLGQRLAYLTDETTIIERTTGAVVPYPKPLSVIVAPDEPKEQQNPAELGLNVVAADDHSYRLERVVIIDRRDEPTSPRIEPVPLAQALMTICEQTSGLMFTREGLRSIADVIIESGGAWRLVYSEVQQAEPLVYQLLSGEGLPEREAEGYQTFEPADALPNVFANGTVTVARAPGSEGYLVGEETFLLHRGEALNELSGFAAECWIAAEQQISSEKHYELLCELFEGLPRDAYDTVITQLSEAGILTVRTVDDPLYTDPEPAELDAADPDVAASEEGASGSETAAEDTAEDADGTSAGDTTQNAEATE